MTLKHIQAQIKENVWHVIGSATGLDFYQENKTCEDENNIQFRFEILLSDLRPNFVTNLLATFGSNLISQKNAHSDRVSTASPSIVA